MYGDDVMARSRVLSNVKDFVEKLWKLTTCGQATGCPSKMDDTDFENKRLTRYTPGNQYYYLQVLTTLREWVWRKWLELIGNKLLDLAASRQCAGSKHLIRKAVSGRNFNSSAKASIIFTCRSRSVVTWLFTKLIMRVKGKTHSEWIEDV